jgi:hypothetical protein
MEDQKPLASIVSGFASLPIFGLSELASSYLASATGVKTCETAQMMTANRMIRIADFVN